MTETITIEAEWDEGALRCSEVRIDGRSIPYRGGMGINIHRSADLVCRLIGDWKRDEERRNVSP